LSTEIRKDYLLNRWVIIASERAKRPTDFQVPKSVITEKGECPFCPGNERMTPPALMLYLPSEKGIVKEKDTDGDRPSNWLVRCIPNLYPALTSSAPAVSSVDKYRERSAGLGAHEVIIESPRHDEHPDNAELKQLHLLIQAYIDRTIALKKWSYVSIFRNHGERAGASLSHPHSQIIATSIVPRLILEELHAYKKLFKEEGVCPYCRIINLERETSRFIYENQNFIAFAPWASIFPFEMWLIPKRHQSSILQLEGKEKWDFAKTLKICLGALSEILKDPPYSYGIHMAPTHEGRNYFHWHLEIYPKLTIQAGFENSTSMYINVTPPEIAAESLRKTAEKIDENL